MQNKKIKYNTEYNKKNTKMVTLRLNVNTDGDIIKHLDSISNMSGYLKDLIRADIKKKKKEHLAPFYSFTGFTGHSILNGNPFCVGKSRNNLR